MQLKVPVPESIRHFEQLTRGAAHHRRILALFLIEAYGPLSVEALTHLLKTDYKNTANHLQKLHRGGLIEKSYKGNYVLHSLTSIGRSLISFYYSIE